MEDFYKILGVNENSSHDEIKKCYRKLQLNYHPDKNNNSTESVNMTQKINEAYSILGDDNKRREYDLKRNNPCMDNFTNNIFEEFFGKSGVGPFVGGPFGGIFGIDGTPMNIKIFHNGVPINIGEKFNKPTPIIQNVKIDITQVLEGCTIPVEIERWTIENEMKVFEKELVYINIPKGIDQGEIIILKNKGNIINDKLKGDLKIMVTVENNTPFVRNGLNLIYNKTLTLKDSLCGFSFNLDYINGKTYTINNNSGNIIVPNYQKIIPNLGLERENYKGNLIIIFNVEFPTTLTEEQVKILKEIL